jgi:hypothetical protein
MADKIKNFDRPFPCGFTLKNFLHQARIQREAIRNRASLIAARLQQLALDPQIAKSLNPNPVHIASR